MRWIGLLLSVAMAPLATAGDLQYRLEGGDHLKVTAVADKQTWRVIDGKNGPVAIVAALVQDRLVIEEFTWGGTPQPEPGPGPQPTPPNPEPGPQPQPQPVPGPKTVLWIEESSARTPSQAAAVVDKAIRNALVAARWTLRVVDVDVVDETGKPPADLAGYLDAARQAGVPRVFILQDGRELYAGAAPADVSSFVDLLLRYGLPVGTPGGEPRGPTGSSPDVARPKQEAAANGCPTGRCPVPTIPTRKWRLFR